MRHPLLVDGRNCQNRFGVAVHLNQLLAPVLLLLYRSSTTSPPTTIIPPKKQHKMNAVKHPIRLQNVVFTRSIVVAIPDYKTEGNAHTEAGPANTLDVVPLEGQAGHYQANMQCKLNTEGSNTSRYLIDMECIGVFFAEENLPAEEALRGVTITANSVLYGAIREAVAWLTSRQPHGTLMLGLSVLQQKAPEKK